MFTWNMSPRHHQAPSEMSKSHTEDFPAICCDAGAECRDKKSQNGCGSKVCDMFPHSFLLRLDLEHEKKPSPIGNSSVEFTMLLVQISVFLAGLANKQTHTHTKKKQQPSLLVRSSTNSYKAAVPLRSVAQTLCTNSCPLAAWLGPQSRIFLGRSRHKFIT